MPPPDQFFLLPKLLRLARLNRNHQPRAEAAPAEKQSVYPGLLTGIGVIVASLLSYFYLDLDLILYLHEHNASTYGFFRSVSILGESTWYLIPALTLGIIFHRFKSPIALKAWFVFSSVAVSGILVDVIKIVLGRPRPGMYFREHLTDFQYFQTASQFLSFPSGHSATVFALATITAYLYPKFRLMAFLVAILVCLSRVMTTKHYLSDILVGAYLGAVSTSILYHLYYRKKIRHVD